MSEEERPVQPEEEPVEESAEEPVPVEEPVPEKADPEARAIASAESQPQDQPQQPRGRSVKEKSTQSREKGTKSPREKGRRPPHPLWRGWWLAVVLLACFVLLGQRPSPGAAWLKQPMRAFAGAVLLGGSLGALPGFLQGHRVGKPAWKRCLLAVLCGFAWGVLA